MELMHISRGTHLPVFLRQISDPNLQNTDIPVVKSSLNNPEEAHLWNTDFWILLIAAISILTTAPVSVHQVPLLPEESCSGVKLCEVFLLRQENMKVL